LAQALEILSHIFNQGHGTHIPWEDSNACLTYVFVQNH
jgi:hypothetical protein